MAQQRDLKLADLQAALTKVADTLGVSVHTATLLLTVPVSTDCEWYGVADERLHHLLALDELPPILFARDSELDGYDVWGLEAEDVDVYKVFGLTQREREALEAMELFYFLSKSDV